MSLFTLDGLDELLATLTRNPVRAGLTAAGVCWGTFLLVVMLGLGDGLQRGVERTVEGSASNAVHLWGRATSVPYGGLPRGRAVRFVTADAEALASELPGVKLVCPRSQLGGYRDGTVVRNGAKHGAFQVAGDTPFYREVQPMRLVSGRWINGRDMDEQRKVAVIGAQVAAELFPDVPDAVGGSIEVQGVWFLVVGVFQSMRGDERGDREASMVHVPLSTFQQVFHQGDRVGWIALVGEEGVQGSELEAAAREVQFRRHRIHPDDRRAIRSWNAQAEVDRIRVLFDGIRGFTWFVGVATLMSGVVGVSNILLITVRERTKEIGIRRAIGATPASVVGMVVQEAIVLTVLAGMTGLVLGVRAVELVSWFVGPNHDTVGQPVLHAETLLVAVLVLLVAGAMAGVLPAFRAVAIEPVQALRSE